MIDCIVIGVGPAGISTAANLRKLNRTTMVIGKDKGQLTGLDVIDNFYLQSPISGEQMMTKGIKQARSLGIEVIKDYVLNIEYTDHFIVTTEHNTYLAQTVVLATGKPRSFLEIPGFLDFKSKGIHLCATCDGLFYRDKNVGIIGDGPYMLQELATLENYTKDIIIFSNGKPFTHEVYPVITEQIINFTGEKRLTHIDTTNKTYEVRGVFIASGYPKASELALKLGIILENENILVDQNMQTNIPGLFAAGDCVGGLLQVPKAVYDGLVAAHGINNYLKEKQK